jgi:hypothetical protein
MCSDISSSSGPRVFLALIIAIAVKSYLLDLIRQVPTTIKI